MKSLIYKDIITLARGSRSMLLIMLILMACLLPSTGLEAYICAVSILFGMMTISSFSYDEHAGWIKYAAVLPVTRRQIVGAKYLLVLILTLAGIVAAFVLGAVIGRISGFVSFDSGSLANYAVFSLFMFAAVTLVCGTAVALVIKFGAEKGRLYIFASGAVPAAVVFAGAKLLEALGVSFSEDTVFRLLLISPLISLVWNIITYSISCGIMERKDIS